MIGIDAFKAHFAGTEGQYVLIGGAASHVLMDAASLRFRSTQDLDIVLCVEAIDAEFGRRFWSFVEAGGYEVRQRSTGEKEFFRFINPKDNSFPKMLELFSRAPDTMKVPNDAYLTPLPIDAEVASLSAILLSEPYYAALQQGHRTVDGVCVLDESLLIPFKALAFLDMSARRQAGDKVDAKDISKQRNDVFRLLQLFPADRRVELSEPVKADLARFVEAVAAEGGLEPKALGLKGTAEDQLNRLCEAYGLEIKLGV